MAFLFFLIFFCDDAPCIVKIYGMSIRLPDSSLPAKPSRFLKFD
jgi:hypothetical protein